MGEWIVDVWVCGMRVGGGCVGGWVGLGGCGVRVGVWVSGINM